MWRVSKMSMDNVCLIQRQTETIVAQELPTSFAYTVCSHWSVEKPGLNDIRRASVIPSR